MDQNYRKLFVNQPWGKITQELTLYAIKLSRSKTWAQSKFPFIDGENTILLEGKSPVDIAYEAISDTLEGREGHRKWNPEKCPNLLAHLCGVVKSKLFNDSKCKENQQSKATMTNEDGEISDPTDVLNIGKTIANPTEDIEFKELLDQITDALSGDEELEVFFDLWTNKTKPKEIIEKMGLKNNNDVTNLHRKLKRRLTQAGIGVDIIFQRNGEKS